MFQKNQSNIVWRYIGYLLLASNTLGIFIIIETAIFGKPYVSLFLIIFLVLIALNLPRRG